MNTDSSPDTDSSERSFVWKQKRVDGILEEISSTVSLSGVPGLDTEPSSEDFSLDAKITSECIPPKLIIYPPEPKVKKEENELHGHLKADLDVNLGANEEQKRHDKSESDPSATQEQINSMDNSDNLILSHGAASEGCMLLNPDCKNSVFKKTQLGMDPKDAANLVTLQGTISSSGKRIELKRTHHDILTTKMGKLKAKFGKGQREIILQLEHKNREWEREISTLRFALKQEREKRRNADILCEKVREQLKRKEEQCSKEVDVKQQLEITLRMLHMELKTVRNNLDQVVKERNDTQKQLSQEQNARILQHGILTSQLCKQKEMEMTQKKTMPDSEVCESHEKENLVKANQMLENKITMLTQELDALKNQDQVKAKKYAEDIEMEKKEINALQKTLQQNEETLANTILQHSEKLKDLTTENAMLKSKLETERQNRERLEMEVESCHSRLTAVMQDHDQCQKSKRDLEFAFHRAQDEWLSLQDKMNFDFSNLKNNNESLSQQLAKIKSKFSSQKIELQQTKYALREKILVLEHVQIDLSQTRHHLKKVEPMCQYAEGKLGEYSGRQNPSQERLCILHSENTLVQQQLLKDHNKVFDEKKPAINIEDQYHETVKKLKVESEKQSLMLKERNKELVNECNHLKEQMCQYENEKVEREVTVRQLQQKLADTLKKQSASEASLTVISHYHNSLEDEKRALKKKLGQIVCQMDDLKANLRESSSEYQHLGAKYQALNQEFLVMKTVQKKCEKLEKNERKLVQEIVNLRSHLERKKTDHRQVEQYKQEIEARARQELEEKLKEVNLFLQTQAISQEYLEKLRETNDASARTQIELRIKELESEISKIKTSQEDFNKAELKKYKELYQDELKIRKAVSSQLNNTNEKLAEMNMKLLIEEQHNRSLLSTLSARPAQESPCVGNSSHSLLFNSNFTPKEHVWITPKEHVSVPAFSKLLPSNDSIDSYLTEMRQELDKTITRELEKDAAEFESASYRTSCLGYSHQPTHELLVQASEEYVQVLRKKYEI